jgi:glycosyltransferase involved in cell wall biosynthesis
MGAAIMRLAYLVPEGSYTFFRTFVPALERHGIRVDVNAMNRPDLVLAGILPADHCWIDPIRASGIPYILWHWDYYSFTNYNEPRWRLFLEMLPRAEEIWSCSYEVARELKEHLTLDSYVIPAWVDESEMCVSTPRDYALYAASGMGFGKRPEWAARACDLLGLPFHMLKNQSLPRAEYLCQLSQCRVYLMTAFEESNGTIPAMEAMACGRPVVCADLPASREVFGSCAYYFQNWDFRSLLTTLQQAWELGPHPGGMDRIYNSYGLTRVATRVAERLEQLHARVQARARGRY